MIFKTYPKIRSGCDMKSVMRSSMLRGSRTKVGKVTRERSMPTLLSEKEHPATSDGHSPQPAAY